MDITVDLTKFVPKLINDRSVEDIILDSKNHDPKEVEEHIEALAHIYRVELLSKTIAELKEGRYLYEGINKSEGFGKKCCILCLSMDREFTTNDIKIMPEPLYTQHYGIHFSCAMNEGILGSMEPVLKYVEKNFNAWKTKPENKKDLTETLKSFLKDLEIAKTYLDQTILNLETIRGKSMTIINYKLRKRLDNEIDRLYLQKKQKVILKDDIYILAHKENISLKCI